MNKYSLPYFFRRLRLPWINRNYKDSTFKLFFNDKIALLELYNAINETSYNDPDALIINTLDNAIFLGMVNDLSFIIDTSLNIYEHQSTKCPNMPLRTLFYASKLLAQIIDEKKLYSSRIQKIPEPHFIVFYNGLDELPEKSIYRLSDMYDSDSSEHDLELIVHIININLGKNQSLMESCEKLLGYSIYVSKVREFSAKMSSAEAVAHAIDYCIKHNILRNFFIKERKAITMVSLYEYDQAGHMELIREEALEQGIAQGIKQGIEQGSQKTLNDINTLNAYLIKSNRMDDLVRSTQDPQYQAQLLQEMYGNVK